MATVMTVAAPEPPPHPGNAFRQQFKRIGIAELVLGGSSVVIAIINIIIYALSRYGILMNAPGIWCGILFVAAGALAISSSKQATQCNIIAGMVLAILSLLSSFYMAFSEGAHAQAVHIIYDGFFITILTHVVLLLIAVAEFIAAIFHIVYTSKSTCCQ